MNQLEAMRVFVRVVELASFTAAAGQLGLPKASVSNAIRDLETWLDIRLLHRTTRKVQITQDGQVFYQRCQLLLADMDELHMLFRQENTQLQGQLRVDMPLAIARDVVLPQLPDWLAQHPKLEIELSSTDRLVDIVQEGCDCVLRVDELADSSLVARPIGAYSVVNCVSNSYADRYGLPTQLADLNRHSLVHYVNQFGSRSAGFEYYDRDHAKTHYVPMKGALTVNNSDAYLHACLAGMGIIQVPEPGIRQYIQSGKLITILPDYRPASMPVYLLYANRHHVPQRVRAFMQWLEQIIQSRLHGTS